MKLCREKRTPNTLSNKKKERKNKGSELYMKNLRVYVLINELLLVRQISITSVLTVGRESQKGK